MAVYTEVNNNQLQEFLSDYDIGSPQSFKGLVEGVQNSNYFLATEQGEYILTLYEQQVASEDLPFFMNLLDHLERKGFPCPAPIKNRQGVALARLANLPAAIFPFIRGVSTTNPTTQQCFQIGEALAQLHLSAQDFPKPWRANGMGLDNWKKLYSLCEDQFDQITPGLSDEISQTIEKLDKNWPTNLPTGICHADLFCDNVLFAHNRIGGVIDFYFSCEELLIYDLAITVNAWSISPFGSFYYSNSHALLKGYQQHRKVSDAEKSVFIMMLQASAIRFLLTRTYDWIHTPKGAMVKRKDPMEYVRNLRFHLKQDSPSFYGFE